MDDAIWDNVTKQQLAPVMEWIVRRVRHLSLDEAFIAVV